MSETKTKEIRIVVPEELFSLFIPEETVDHFINARKEVLLGLRSMIDAKIEVLDKKRVKKTEKKKKIKVE
jgi:hypothetical protein